MKSLTTEMQTHTAHQSNLLRKYEEEEQKQRAQKHSRLREIIHELNTLIDTPQDHSPSKISSATPLSLALLQTLITQLKSFDCGQSSNLSQSSSQAQLHELQQTVLKRAMVFQEQTLSFVNSLKQLLAAYDSTKNVFLQTPSQTKSPGECASVAIKLRSQRVYARLMNANDEVAKAFDKMCSHLKLSNEPVQKITPAAVVAANGSSAAVGHASPALASSSVKVLTEPLTLGSLPAYAQEAFSELQQMHKRQLTTLSHIVLTPELEEVLNQLKAKLRLAVALSEQLYCKENLSQLDPAQEHALMYDHLCDCVDMCLLPLRLCTAGSGADAKMLTKCLLSCVQTVLESAQSLSLSESEYVLDQQICMHAVCLHGLVYLQADKLSPKLLSMFRCIFMDASNQTVPYMPTSSNVNTQSDSAGAAAGAKIVPANYLTFKLFASLCAFSHVGTLAYMPGQLQSLGIFGCEYGYVWIVRYFKQTLEVITNNAQSPLVAESVFYLKEFLKYAGFSMLQIYGRAFLDILSSFHQHVVKVTQPQKSTNKHVGVLVELIGNIVTSKRTLKMCMFQEKYVHVIGSTLTFRCGHVADAQRLMVAMDDDDNPGHKSVLNDVKVCLRGFTLLFLVTQ
jgi:hypothetical protein